MTGIYCITNNINGKKYIGQSINIKRRWSEEKHGSCNKDLYNDFLEYGIENFSFEILEECKKDELDKKERFYIKKEKTVENGYNILYGGVGWEYPENVKKQISNSLKGRKRPQEQIEKFKSSIRKNNNLSKIHGRAIRNKKTGEEFETIKKAQEIIGSRIKNLKDKFGNEYEYIDGKEKKKYIIKNKNYNYKSAISQFKKVQCVETGEIFESLKAAQEKYGGDIHKAVDKADKIARGFHWTTNIDYNKEIIKAKPIKAVRQRLTKEEFLEKVKNNLKEEFKKYDFSETEYKNETSKVKFKCLIHGEKETLAKYLLKHKIVCPECYQAIRSEIVKKGWEKRNLKKVNRMR